MSVSRPTWARTLRGGRCAKSRGQGHESSGVQGRRRKGSTWGCQPVAFLCRQSVIRAQAMAESPRDLLLQSWHQTRVPTPFISPVSPVGGASAHNCSPDSAGDTPSVNLLSCPCGEQAVLGGLLLGDGLRLSPWRTAVELRIGVNLGLSGFLPKYCTVAPSSWMTWQ